MLNTLPGILTIMPSADMINATEPTTPLHNADHGGSFIFRTDPYGENYYNH